MADIVNIKTRKIWVTCGHTHGGACAGCIRRDLLNPYEQLEKALKYCQDDKEIMQNQIDVFQRQVGELRGALKFYNPRSSLL